MVKSRPEPCYINLNQRVGRSHIGCLFNEQGFNVLASLPRVLILGIQQKTLNHQCKTSYQANYWPTLCPLYWYAHQRGVLLTNPSSSGWTGPYRMSKVITKQNSCQPFVELETVATDNAENNKKNVYNITVSVQGKSPTVLLVIPLNALLSYWNPYDLNNTRSYP